MVMRFDLEHDRPAFADAHRACVFAGALQDGASSRGQAAEQCLGALVGAVFRPQDAEHAELDLVGGSLQLLENDPVLIRGERNLPQLALIHRFDAQDTRTFKAVPATDLKSFNPSVPPSSASEHRSG